MELSETMWTVIHTPGVRIAIDVHNPTPMLSWHNSQHPLNTIFTISLRPALEQAGLGDAIVYIPQ